MKKFLSEKVLGKIAYQISTDKPFETVLKNLEKAIVDNDFSIITTHDMRKTVEKNNLEISRDFEYRIIELCNAQKAHKALGMSMNLGIMMPKSIIISRENGKTVLRYMQMKPWMVGMMFPDINIVPMSKNVMGTMKKIVHEAIS
jgi:uncharacterized protein (DUF302 family)